MRSLAKSGPLRSRQNLLIVRGNCRKIQQESILEPARFQVTTTDGEMNVIQGMNGL